METTEMRSKVRVHLVDDHPAVLRGLQMDLAAVPYIEIAGASTNGLSALESIAEHREAIDVVLTDIEMPNMNGYELCKQLKSIDVLPRVVFLTYRTWPESVFKAHRVEADGYVNKMAGVDEIARCILDVHSKDVVEEPGYLLDNGQYTNNRQATQLSRAEQAVLYYLVCKEMTTKEVAVLLNRSPHTIEQQRKTMMIKLGVDSVVGLVKYGLSIDICNNGLFSGQRVERH